MGVVHRNINHAKNIRDNLPKDAYRKTVDIDFIAPAGGYADVGPNPQIDKLLPLVYGKTDRQIENTAISGSLTLQQLRDIEDELTNRREPTHLNKLTAVTVGLAIARIEGEI